MSHETEKYKHLWSQCASLYRKRETNVSAVISSSGASWLMITAWQKSFIVVKAVLANPNRELKRRDASNAIPFSLNINKKHHLAQYQVVYDEYLKTPAGLEALHDAKKHQIHAG